MFPARAARLEPTHFVVKSRDARAANRAAVTLARNLDPEFALLELREPATATAGNPNDWTGFVPSARHLICAAPVGGVGPDAGALPSWPLVRADAPDRVISNLMTFLSQPEASQHLLRPYLPGGRPLVMVVVNGYLAARHFPDDPEVTRRLMSVQKVFHVSVVFTADESPRRDYTVFDYVFDVLPAGEDAGGLRLRCGRARWEEGIRPGGEITLRELSMDPGSLPPASSTDDGDLPNGSRPTRFGV